MATQPRSILCVKTAFNYFSSNPDLSGIRRECFEKTRTEACRVLESYGLDLDGPFPSSPLEQNALWREKICPIVAAFREEQKYQRLKKSHKLPDGFTNEEVDEAIRSKNRRKSRQYRAERARQAQLQIWAEEAEKQRRLDEEEEKRQQQLRAREAKRQLRLEAAEADKQKRLAREAKTKRELGLEGCADASVAASLLEKSLEAIRSSSSASVYHLYFKVWIINKAEKWYKVGITNNLMRRDHEQNVLPVPSVTIYTIGMPSHEIAASVERAFHDALSNFRVQRAGNRELFLLAPPQVISIIATMKHLEGLLGDCQIRLP